MKHEEEKEGQYVTIIMLDDCLFFLFSKMKKKDSKREREGEKKKKGNRRSSTNTSAYVSICKCVCDMSQTVASILHKVCKRNRAYASVSKKLL